MLREQSPATTQSLYRAIKRLGAPIIRLAMTRAMREVGCKLFPGETIKSALQATTSAKSNDLHSFDMLGKAACTQADAEHYFASYGRAIAAKLAAIGLSRDAEEASRLVLSLSVIEQVLATPKLVGWDGFGVVVQANGPRASGVIDHLYGLAQRHDRQITIRLVKGAYWDS